jgi:drug/metabolite transporter (DMT)-like permease
MSAYETTDEGRPAKRTTAFDVRIVIGLLLGIYGVVLVVTGLINTSEADLAKSDGVNINLWAGVGLIVAAIVFMVWARLRPLLVPLDNPGSQAEQGPPGD